MLKQQLLLSLQQSQLPLQEPGEVDQDSTTQVVTLQVKQVESMEQVAVVLHHKQLQLLPEPVVQAL